MNLPRSINDRIGDVRCHVPVTRLTDHVDGDAIDGRRRWVDPRTRGAVMEERSIDFCKLTNEELDHVVAGNGCTNVTVQGTLIAKKEVLRAAQAKFEQ